MNWQQNKHLTEFSTDQAKKQGIHRDNIDHQFRWRNKHQQDRCASTTNPSYDGIVSAALCKDGPIHYHIKEFSGIDDAWVCDNNVIHIVNFIICHFFLWM